MPRTSYDGRTWHERRTFVASDPLPEHDASAELPRLMPVTVAIVHAEDRKTKDAQALRATGSPPPGVSQDQAVRLLLSGVCDERQAFVGLRNMFMQSGVTAQMRYDLLPIPPNGLCVWLVAALLFARLEAKAAAREEPKALSTGQVLDALRMLHDALDKMKSAENQGLHLLRFL